MKTKVFFSPQSMFIKNMLLLFFFVIFSVPAFSQTPWYTTGNSLSSGPPTEFLGTTNGYGLMFKVGGAQCGYVDIILDNTSLGKNALNLPTSGGNNVAFGENSLAKEVSGSNNVGVGYAALGGDRGGDNNVAVGFNSLSSNSTGIFYNTALGNSTLASNNTGCANVALGNQAGYQNNGDRNVFLGDSAGFYETADNDRLFIGNYTNPDLIDGDFANDIINLNANTNIGTPDPTNASSMTGPYLHAQGDIGTDATLWYFAISGWSDERLKTNIQPLENNALSKVLKLNSKTYNFNKKINPNAPEGKQIGYLAQELNEVFPELVKKGGKYYGVNYIGLIPVITQAIKEQQSIIDSLRTQLSSMQACVYNLCTTLQNANGTQANNTANVQQVSLASLDRAILFQNTPNPFGSGGTKISYFLPEGTVGASMVFFDTYGNKLKEVELSQTGMSTINIDATQMKNGVYSYSLIINGQMVDTRKMELAK